MAELAPLDALDPNAPLRDVKVLEVAGEYSGYAGRLLADLGAEVTRVTLADVVGPSRESTLLLEDPALDASAWFLHRGKRQVRVGVGSDRDDPGLAELIRATDVVLQSAGADVADCEALSPASVRAANPGVVHAIMTPYGLDGPAAGYVSADLVRLAAGGLLWLGGYPEEGPVAPFGDQSTMATAIFGVVGVLLALIESDRTGAGETVEVSSQEVMTQALETSIPEYELTGRVQRRLGDTPREAGSGVFRCRDGFVSMIAGRLGTAQAWTRLREWLVEEGTPGADQLLDPGWGDLDFRRGPEAVARFTEIFCAFAGRWSKQELYLEAQRRSIALSPVNSLQEVLEDGQLASRRSFLGTVDETSGAHGLVPAPPYRLSPLGPEPPELEASDAAGAVVGPPPQ